MDNLSDYIPLIIIIGSLVYSVVKGVGKKKQEELSKTSLPGHTSYDEEVDYPEVFPEIKPVKKQQKKIKLQKPNPIVVHQAVTSSLQKEVVSEPEEPEEFVLDIENTDEIKKAFIYTEIFNRKNY